MVVVLPSVVTSLFRSTRLVAGLRYASAQSSEPDFKLLVDSNFNPQLPVVGAAIEITKSEREWNRRNFNLKKNMLKGGSNVYFLRRLQDSSERSTESS